MAIHLKQGQIVVKTEETKAAPGISGRWVNRGGTVIDLRAHTDGRVAGTLKLGADGRAYRLYQVKGRWIARGETATGIVGTVSGWPHASSVSVWCADVDEDDGSLSGRFMSVGETPLPSDWEAATGGSEFRRADLPRRRTA